MRIDVDLKDAAKLSHPQCTMCLLGAADQKSIDVCQFSDRARRRSFHGRCIGPTGSIDYRAFGRGQCRLWVISGQTITGHNRLLSAVTRWSQRIDATLYLIGKRWSVTMDQRFRRGFTAAEKTELWDCWQRG